MESKTISLVLIGLVAIVAIVGLVLLFDTQQMEQLAGWASYMPGATEKCLNQCDSILTYQTPEWNACVQKCLPGIR